MAHFFTSGVCPTSKLHISYLPLLLASKQFILTCVQNSTPIRGIQPIYKSNLHSECLTKEALEAFGDFKIGGQIIHTVKYADDLVLLAKEEIVLQDMIDKLIEIGRCYGMEMNVEKIKSNENFKTTITSKNYDRPKTTKECGIF
jgi:hypothetical protein